MYGQPNRRRLLGGIVGLTTGAIVTLAGRAGGSGEPSESGPSEGETGNGGETGEGPEPGSAGLALSSEAFADGGAIPPAFTCEGADRNPALSVSGVPDDASSLALVVDDPDAPSPEPFVHWLIWNLPPGVGDIPEDVPRTGRVAALDDAVQGTNGFGEVGYRGPCPPTDDGPHTYKFRLSAVDRRLDVEPGSDRSTLERALDGAVLAETTLGGTFGRS